MSVDISKGVYRAVLGIVATANRTITFPDADITIPAPWVAPGPYVPTLTNIGGTAPTVVARYEQHGKRVFGAFNITMAAGTTFGAGNLGVSAPVAAVAGATWRVGAGTIFDSSTAQLFTICGYLATTGRFEFLFSATTNVVVTNLVPWTWATNDQLNLEFQYEAA